MYETVVARAAGVCVQGAFATRCLDSIIAALGGVRHRTNHGIYVCPPVRPGWGVCPPVRPGAAGRGCEAQRGLTARRPGGARPRTRRLRRLRQRGRNRPRPPSSQPPMASPLLPSAPGLRPSGCFCRLARFARIGCSGGCSYWIPVCVAQVPGRARALRAHRGNREFRLNGRRCYNKTLHSVSS